MHAVLINLQGIADKVDRVKNAQTGIVSGSWHYPSTPGPIKSIGLECTDWDCVRFIGLEFARTPYPKMHGLANTIDSVKNARARIVQGSWG